MSDESKITTSLIADDPKILDARYRFDDHDRRYIDNQIIGTQTHLQNSLLDGLTATWRVLASDSVEIAVGDGLCIKDSSVTKANSASLSNAGALYGVALIPAKPGAMVNFAIGGAIPPEISGLGTGLTQPVRVNTTTGRLERVSSYAEDDFPAGVSDPFGSVTLNIGAVAANIVVSGVPTSAVVVGAISIGDVICSAANSGSATKVTKAIPSALTSASTVEGIALEGGSDGATITYAGAGTVVDATSIGLSAGNAGPVVTNSSARVARTNYVDAGNYVVGHVDTQGHLRVLPERQLGKSVRNPKSHPYNAKGDGTTSNTGTDDYTALQSCIDDAVAQANFDDFSVAGAIVDIPSGCYNISKPLRLRGCHTQICGAGRSSTWIAPTWTGGGFGIVVGPPVAPGDLFAVEATPTRGGNRIICSAASTMPYLPLNTVVATTEFNGLTALTVSVYFELDATGDGGTVIACSGQRAESEPWRTCFALTNQGSAMRFWLTTTQGATFLDTPGGTVSTSTEYHFECSWDGTNMRIFKNGVMVAKQAWGGTLVRYPYEEVTLPARVSKVPSTILASYGINGRIAEWQVRKLADHSSDSSFTPPTNITYNADNHTLMFCDWNPSDHFDLFYKVQSYRGDAWVPIFRAGWNVDGGVPGSGQPVVSSGIRDLSTYIGFGNCDGMYLYEVLDSEFRNINLAAMRIGLWFRHGGYNNVFENFHILAQGSTDLGVVMTSGGPNRLDNFTSAGKAFAFAFASGAYTLTNSFINGFGVGIYMRGSPELVVNVENVGTSDEASFPSDCHYMVNGINSLSVNMCPIDLTGNTLGNPAFWIEGEPEVNGGYDAIHITGVSLRPHPTTREIVHFPYAATPPKRKVIFEGEWSDNSTLPLTLNNQAPIDLFPNVVDGLSNVSMSDDLTLSMIQWVNNTLVFSGETDANRYVEVPLRAGDIRTIVNNCSAPIVIGTATIANGRTCIVESDGTTIYRASPDTINVAPVSPTAPMDMAGILACLDPDPGLALVSTDLGGNVDGGKVINWFGQGGGAPGTVAQGTSADRPFYRSHESSLHGQPGIGSDAPGTTTMDLDNADLVIGTTFTVCVVHSTLNLTGNERAFGFESAFSGSTANRAIGQFGGDNKVFDGSGLIGTTPIALGHPVIVTYVQRSGGNEIYCNGFLRDTSAHTTASVTGFTVCGDATAGEPLTGWVGLVAIFDHDLDPVTELPGLHEYLRERFKISSGTAGNGTGYPNFFGPTENIIYPEDTSFNLNIGIDPHTGDAPTKGLSVYAQDADPTATVNKDGGPASFQSGAGTLLGEGGPATLASGGGGGFQGTSITLRDNGNTSGHYDAELLGNDNTKWISNSGSTEVATEIYEHTTSATTAHTTIATIPLREAANFQVVITAKRGTSDSYAATISSLVYYNGATYTQVDTNGTVGTLWPSASTMDPQLVVSSTNLLVKVTPTNSGSTTWSVVVQRVTQ